MKVSDLEQMVLNRTANGVRDLRIELSAERVILRGEATSFYVKQLAQEGIRSVLPRIRLLNAIVVPPRVDHFVTAEAS